MIATPPAPRRLQGYFFALGATALWSGSFIVARGLNESISPVSLAFWRWAVAVIVFLPFGIKLLVKERAAIKENGIYLAVTAIMGVTFFNTLVYLAAATTSAINLSLISITSPVFVIIIQRIFFAELIPVRRLLGIVLAVIGMILLITKGHMSLALSVTFAIGDLWMLMAAILFAVYSILIQRRPKQLSICSFQLSTFILGLVFLAPIYLWDQMEAAPALMDSTTIASIVYSGICASLVAYFFWNRAIADIGSIKAGMIYYTLPLFCGLLAFVILGEGITLVHLYSALLILTGIFMANYGGKIK